MQRESDSNLKSVSLKHLIHLSQEARWAAVLEHGQADLAAVLQALGSECAALSETMDVERLGWAIAFNVEGPCDSQIEGHVSKRRAIQCYCDRWNGETPWRSIWSLLTKSVTGRNCGADCLMAELALSVACEHRDDWQNPAARPINVQNAGRSFEFVYERAKLKVLGHVFKRFGERAGAPAEIAADAWSEVFRDLWSISACRRFLGICKISTLVCQVATYGALDKLPSRDPDITTIDSETDRQALTHKLLISLGFRSDPTTNLHAKELHRLIENCMLRLSVRQRIVAEMVWLQDIRAKEVSKILQISEAAVSQHLKKAREAVGGCLRTYGYQASA